MLLRELLPPEHIFVPLHAATLDEAITTMLDGLAAGGELRDTDEIRRALRAVRSRASVPVGERVVLPHVRSRAVDHLILALGISPAPLDTRAAGLSTAPQVVALLIAPPETASLYLQTLALLARLFRQGEVVDALVGARSPQEVRQLATLGESRIQPRLTVRDMMGQRPGIPPAAPVRLAIDLLLEQRVKALPVVGDKGEVLGILTEWDVMRALLPQVPRAEDDPETGTLIVPPDLLVRDIMTRSVLCISEDMGLDEVANMMLNKDVEQFPVVKEGKLTGFLGRSDIIRKLFGQ